ncbi:hypothetical protein [uncultured Clostridium sp.]|uniref:hypothetical protein n=1 Tax=uncultured Clostridium sp. TaxID=59620 RepID=UPI00321679DF
MFKDTDSINIYNDYDYKIYMGSVDALKQDYVLMPKIDNEPYYIPVLWRDIIKANQISVLFKERAIRFEEDIEEEAYKQLRIDFKREKESYSRQEIESMILNPTDEVIRRIVSISKLSVIESFLSQLVALKNSNKYFIAEKVELYIRARKEEILEGIRKSELEVTPTENIELAVVETEEIKEEKEVVEKEKPKTTGKTTTKNNSTSKKKENK